MDIKNHCVSATSSVPDSFPLVPDEFGWFHGFIQTVGEKFGFICVNLTEPLYFNASQVDWPMTISNLRHGDPVEFHLSSNRKGIVACNVRKTFAFRAA